MKRFSRMLSGLRGNRRRWRLKALIGERLTAMGEAARYGARLALRYLARSIPYVLLAVTAMLVPIAVLYGYRYVTAAPDFQVQEVTVEGNTRVTAERILEIARVDDSPNMLSLDLDEVEARLVSDPWIKAAEVSRELPDKLMVDVQEHEPLALIALGALYLTDARGEIFKRVEPGEHFDFPVLTGLTRRDLGPDAVGDRALLAQRLVRGAIRLLGVWTHSAGKMNRVSEIHMDPLFGYSVVLGAGSEQSRGAIVHLGRGKIIQKLKRLQAILADAARRGRRIGEVRLNDSRDPGRVAVRFRPGGLESAVDATDAEERPERL